MSLIITIHAKPGSSQQKIKLNAQGKIIISVVSQAEKGRANDEIIAFLAKALSCAKKEITIIGGHFAHIKKIMLTTVKTPHALLQALKLDRQTNLCEE